MRINFFVMVTDFYLEFNFMTLVNFYTEQVSTFFNCPLDKCPLFYLSTGQLSTCYDHWSIVQFSFDNWSSVHCSSVQWATAPVPHSPDTAPVVDRSPWLRRRRCLHCGSTSHSRPRSAEVSSIHRRTASVPPLSSPSASSPLATRWHHASAGPPVSPRCRPYRLCHQL